MTWCVTRRCFRLLLAFPGRRGGHAGDFVRLISARRVRSKTIAARFAGGNFDVRARISRCYEIDQGAVSLTTYHSATLTSSRADRLFPFNIQPQFKTRLTDHRLYGRHDRTFLDQRQES